MTAIPYADKPYGLVIESAHNGEVLFERFQLDEWPQLPHLAALWEIAPSWPGMLDGDLSAPLVRAVIFIEDREGNRIARQSWPGFWRKGNGSECLNWQEGTGLSPPRIVICADLDGFCIFGEHGGLESFSDDFPDVPEIRLLESELMSWALPHDRAYEACRAVRQDMQLDWESFNTKGIALATKLKSLIAGHAEMFYEKAPWDPTRFGGHGYRII